ncbi:MAG TPA: hypothetical protein VNL18_10925 [Gemmatimonadales bacterium]|nr:hypothetical protein [Gemmatimonadales bacterium]
MLCKACEVLQEERRRAGVRDAVTAGAQSDQLGVLLCERCGAVLPAVDSADTLLHKLSQLAQFGIGAGSGPLLTRSRKGV